MQASAVKCVKTYLKNAKEIYSLLRKTRGNYIISNPECKAKKSVLISHTDKYKTISEDFGRILMQVSNITIIVYNLFVNNL